MKLTVAICTSRLKPQLNWLMDSLCHQISSGDKIQIILVDLFAERFDGWSLDEMFNRKSGVIKEVHRHPEIDSLWHRQVKPNPWSGAYRITKENWWSKASAINTAICVCETEWLSFVDDRCILMPGWLDSIREAMVGGYGVCGTYEKRVGMQVVDGAISVPGEVTGRDDRVPLCNSSDFKNKMPASWFYGCAYALPLEWLLAINGANELLDGLGAEDTCMGAMLTNNGFPLRFDPRMQIIEDRTPSECLPVMKRSSKEKHPNDINDKGHEAIRRFYHLKASPHPFDIRELRAATQSGMSMPTQYRVTTDWFDQKLICEH